MELSAEHQLATQVAQTLYWRNNRQFMRRWELTKFVREALKEKGYDKQMESLTEFECLVQRIAAIRRSRSAKRGARTRRRNIVKRAQMVLNF